MSDICSIKRTSRGWSVVSRDEIKAQALTEYQTNMLAAAKLAAVTDDNHAKVVAAQAQAARAATEAKIKLRRSRFHSYRAEPQRDTLQDPNVQRRHRGFSITRDIFGATPNVQNVYDLTRAGGGLGARRNAMATQADPQRFAREAYALVMSQVMDKSDLPDWEDDISIMRFFDKVNALAMRDAKETFVGKRGRNRVIDAAPGIYLFTELLKRTERLIEEDFTELWARRIFPILNLNTWLPMWNYERIDDRVGFPRNVDIEDLPSDAPRGSENRDAVLCGLVFYHHAASWTDLELMRYAEAMANGAPNIDLSQRRINAAVRMMNWWEDILTFFGDEESNIAGLFSPETGVKGTGIERVPAGGKFGSFGTPEGDRQLLTREVKRIYERTTGILRPDTIMLSTSSWLYVNDTRYGDTSADSNQTVLDAALATLDKFGITEVMEVPEVGYSPSEAERLKDHGITDTTALQKYAGGLSGEQTMVVMKRDSEVMEMIVAKDRINYPAREQRHGRVEARMLQGSGGMAFYKPEGIKIVTNVGPDPVAAPPEPN